MLDAIRRGLTEAYVNLQANLSSETVCYLRKCSTSLKFVMKKKREITSEQLKCATCCSRMHSAQCTYWPAVKYNATCSPNLLLCKGLIIRTKWETTFKSIMCKKMVNLRRRVDCTCKRGSRECHSKSVSGVFGINRNLSQPARGLWQIAVHCAAARRVAAAAGHA